MEGERKGAAPRSPPLTPAVASMRRDVARDGAPRGRRVACSCLEAHFHLISPRNPSSAHALQVDESSPLSSRSATLLSLFQLL